ncbi:hypothetical protein J6590_014850 [Homalodisca vitripennis]|nr:hypothetical protein J6590_014850 [Homalodisca vitripennis]
MSVNVFPWMKSQPQPHSCDVCGRSYKYKDNLTRHKRQECGKEPQFACSVNVFPWMKSQPQPHSCDVCGRSYKYKDNLTRHKRQECGKEPQFACSFCPYKARYRSTLHAHLVCKHSADK